MNSPLDGSLPRSRSAVLSSPAWPFYKKSFHLTAEAFLWWAIQGPNTHGLMNSSLDCSLPRSRSAVLSSPAWPFYKKSFHLTAEAFLWWAIQGPNTHGLMNSSLDCSLPRSRSAVLSSPAWPFYKKKLPPYGRSFSLVGHPGAQHPRTNEQSTGLFITSLSLGRPFKSWMAFL